MKLLTLIIKVLLLSAVSYGQAGYFQQEIKYVMDVDLDVTQHLMTGTQEITYTNNSPDTLQQLFFHLYFNAFQPGSMMDIRSRTISDADSRVGSRISNLSPDEMGYQLIEMLKVNGQSVPMETEGTILEVYLPNPILPGETVDIRTRFRAQVPIQIRRTGRDNQEGIDYSMTQWYPKLSEYDEDGWHPNPYVGREFYGVWGDFDVTLHIDDEYVVSASGEEISKSDHRGKTVYRFIAKNVHDFAWAADPDYVTNITQLQPNLTLHTVYQPDSLITERWEKLPVVMKEAFAYANEHYGKYPYPVYKIVQGGDGGMEYAMITLITGQRSFNSLVGVSVHEMMHSWYQMVLGFDEAKYAWMDEGFTSYASRKIMNHLASKGLLENRRVVPRDSLFLGDINTYKNIVTAGIEEPLTTHSDHFITNYAYGVGSYVKGKLFLSNLEYIIGEEAFQKTMLQFYERWKFKHPDGSDFMKVAEDVSGMVLDWYYEYWINTTHHIDYAIDTVRAQKDKTLISLNKEGGMPMPIEVMVEYNDGTSELYYMPLRMMRGEKYSEDKATILADWPWTHDEYSFIINRPYSEIQEVFFHYRGNVADINSENDRWLR